jgi:RNA polymerase sigma factor (sigma-70 family)
MMNEDMDLVREYAASRSDEAFETLVSRHVGLVHSAALRQVRDPHLAGEITQTVLLILARKAGSLGPKTILPGWLYRTTRYVSAAAVKIQRRRERREQEACMETLIQEPQTDPAWEQLAPLLDEAMTCLRDRDRDAIVLRYFQNKSLREVGAVFGMDEYAAQKRVSRALDKLRKFFAGRGVVSTAAAIAGAMSAHTVQAAPGALAQAVMVAGVAKGAVAGGSTLTLIKGALKLMAWTKVKTAAVVGAGILLAAGTATLVVKAINPTALSPTGPSLIRSDGRVAKIERYEFSAATIRYSYPPSNSQPRIDVIGPAYPGERLLSAEFSWQVGPDHPTADGLRVAAADELGNEFDPAAQDMNVMNGGDGKQYWIGEVPVFPRRGNELRLRLLNRGQLLAEFKMPNPARGPHPSWTAQPLPVSATNDDLVAALTGFRSRITNSQTECVFALRENDRETTAWIPYSFEVGDATGNHWMTSRSAGGNPYKARVENGGLRCEFLGALWPGESAWKIRTGFKRMAEFPENELLTIAKIRIPDAT